MGDESMKRVKRNYLMVSILAVTVLLFTAFTVNAKTAAEIDRDVDISIEKLRAGSPIAKELAKTAKGILVFPSVVKGGLIVGGQYGVGALREGGKTSGYYNTVAASYGLQAGAQAFGYAMFFMKDSALQYLKESQGWEVGSGPSFVVMDEGMAKSFTTSSAKDDIYVFFYGQQGMMAGLGIQGSKITKIEPDK